MVLISMVWIFVFFFNLLMPFPLDCKILQIKGWMCVRFSHCIPASNTMPGWWQALAPCWLPYRRAVCLLSSLPGLVNISIFFFQDHPSPSWPSASPSLRSFYAVSPDRSYFRHRRSLGMVMPFPEHSLSLSASQLLFLLKDDPAFWDLTAPNYTSFLNRLVFAQLFILNWTLSWRNYVFYGWGHYLLLCW